MLDIGATAGRVAVPWPRALGGGFGWRPWVAGLEGAGRMRCGSHLLRGFWRCVRDVVARSLHRMKISEVLVLLAAGILGGIFSTAVSIASLVTYPALLALGVPPLSANMTNTVSLVLTGAGSVASSGPELTGQGRRVLRLGVITALGGAAGASVLLLVQPKVKKLAPAADGGHRLVHGAALFAVAMYVGYFGAAAGVFLLVVLGMMIDESLVKVNAVKNALSGMANAMAAVCFALFGDVRWTFVAPLAAGFLIGGWIGPKIARKVPAGMFRVFVSLCGIGLAVKLGISAYR